MGKLEQTAAEVAQERQQQQQQQQPCLDVVAAAVVAASCASQERWQQQWRQQWQQLSCSNVQQQQQQQQQCTSIVEHPRASATLHTVQPALVQQYESGCSELFVQQQQFLELALPVEASAGSSARPLAAAAAPRTAAAAAASAAAAEASPATAAAVLSRRVRRPPRLPAFMQAAGQEQLQPHQLQQQQERLSDKPWQQQLQRQMQPHQLQQQQQLALLPLVLQEQQQHRTVLWPSQQQLASPMRRQQHQPWLTMPAGSNAGDPAAAAAAGVATWGTPQVRRVARLQPRQLSTAPTVVGCLLPEQQRQHQQLVQMHAIEQQQQRQQQEEMQAVGSSNAQVLVVDHNDDTSTGQPCQWHTPQQVQLLEHHQQQPAAATPQVPPEAAAAAAAAAAATVSQPIPAAVPMTPMTQQLLQYELESLQRAEQLLLQLQAALDCRQQQAAALQQHIAQLTIAEAAAAGEGHDEDVGDAATVGTDAVQQQQQPYEELQQHLQAQQDHGENQQQQRDPEELQQHLQEQQQKQQQQLDPEQLQQPLQQTQEQRVNLELQQELQEAQQQLAHVQAEVAELQQEHSRQQQRLAGVVGRVHQLRLGSRA
jgi:hypothetical protein